MMSPNMNFTIWMSSILLIPFGWHFGTVFGLWGSPPTNRAEFFIRIAIIVVLFIVAAIGFAIASAMRAGDDEFEPDEREAQIIQKAERNGYFVLSIGVFALMWVVFDPWSPMDIANGLLAMVCLSEVAKILSGLFYLRVGDR